MSLHNYMLTHLYSSSSSSVESQHKNTLWRKERGWISEKEGFLSHSQQGPLSSLAPDSYQPFWQKPLSTPPAVASIFPVFCTFLWDFFPSSPCVSPWKENKLGSLCIHGLMCGALCTFSSLSLLATGLIGSMWLPLVWIKADFQISGCCSMDGLCRALLQRKIPQVWQEREERALDWESLNLNLLSRWASFELCNLKGVPSSLLFPR